jgi:hypothetical protein
MVSAVFMVLLLESWRSTAFRNLARGSGLMA